VNLTDGPWKLILKLASLGLALSESMECTGELTDDPWC
jgi:hypothetical protein